MNYKLENLIDLKQIQSLLDRLNEIYSFPTAIVDNSGKVLAQTGWQDICLSFHRTHKECTEECNKSDRYIIDHLNEANPSVIYHCPHGLIDNATPIYIEGKHVGNFFTGQYFLKEPNIEFFRNQARRFGFDETAYLEAVKKVPIWTEEQLSKYLYLVKGLVEVISSIAYKNLKEREAYEKVKETEYKYWAIVKSAIDGFWLVSAAGKIFEVNNAYCQMSGYSENELLALSIPDLDALDKGLNDREIAAKSLYFKGGVFESIHRRKDGSLFDVEVNVNYFGENKTCYVFIRDITSRKQAEKQLFESKENYKNLINNVNDLVCEVNEQGIYTFLNYKYKENFGYEPSELIGKQAVDLIHPDDLQPCLAKYSNLIKSKEQSTDIWRFRHKNGQYRVVESKGNLYINSKGETRVVVISRDITEKINAENQLKESEEKYRLLVEMSPDAIVVHQNDRFVFCNRAALKIFGASKNSELLGLNFYDQVHPDFRGVIKQKIFNVLHRRENIPLIQIKVLKLDGLILDVDIVGTIFLHEGRPAVQFLIRDITEKIKSVRHIKEAEERYRTAFKISPDAVNINKLDGTFVDINEGFTALTGYTEEDVLGISSIKINIWAIPEDREKLIKGLNETGKVENLESVFRRKDGTLTTALMSARIISVDDEPHILSITRDISARKAIENELVRAKEKAEESDRLKTAFLQNMSHEIRTPMNAIIGFSSLLPNYFGNIEKLAHYSEIINQRSHDLLTIINDLLDISRIESGQITLVPEEFELKSFVDEIIEVIEKYKQTIKKQHIKFLSNLHSVPDNYTIVTDKVKLKQVFTNLIENAFKFTNEGVIELGCRIEKGNLEFYVSDTGIGIPEEKQQAVFDRFVQVDAGLSRKHGGTGLGLSIVKGLVQLLNGKIWLESEPGKGSTFFFTLPVASKKLNSQKAVLGQGKKLREISDLSILIVEDDAFNAEYLNEIFNSHGNVIYKAVYGYEAIEIAEHNKLDVILMDIRLPDMDGYEVTKIIKQSKPQLKIIAQTAYATATDEQKSLDSGCDAYISKPINKNELFSKILKIVNNKL